jgi:hypothetical protein
MTQTNVRVQIQIRRDTAANWNSADPTLLAGEWGYETDSGKIKIGDGSYEWTNLPYAFVSTKGGNMTDHLTIHNKKELRLTDNTKGTAADHYSAFKAGTQSADLTYTLPTTQPGSGTQYLGCTSAGVLSWGTGSSSDSTKMPLAGGTFVGDVIFNDDVKAIYGTSSDGLEIYHDASNSYINETGTGDLIIDSSHIIFKDGGTEVLETTNSGIRIKDSKTLAIGSNSDLQLMHDTSENFILSPNNHTLNVEGDEIQLRAVNDEKYFKGVKDGPVEIYYNNSLKIETYASGVKTTGNIRPTVDDTYHCGVSGAKWDNVYATNGTIQTSDRNEKNNIIESDLGLSFINKLKPVSYKWNNTKYHKTYYGLIAQDLEQTLLAEDKTINDFAGLDKPSDGPMGLNYSEFISPLIKAVQELTTKIETLETEVASLKG